MLRRIRTTAGALVALGALALGGSAIASATQGPARATSHHAKAAVHAVAPKAASETPGARDGDNVQSGDQSTPDSASAATAEAPDSGSAAEKTSSEADGPGGHQDPPGANVDHQFQGQE